jgi:hypothetical protein
MSKLQGPKGQDSLAQGLPWVSQKNVFSPEGAPWAGMPQLRSEDNPRHTYGPFRAGLGKSTVSPSRMFKLQAPSGHAPKGTPRLRDKHINAELANRRIGLANQCVGSGIQAS